MMVRHTSRVFLLLAVLALVLAAPSSAERHSATQAKTPQPKLVHSVPVPYPEVPEEERVAGRVIAEFLVDEEGHVKDVEIVDSLGKAFDDAVLGALPQWRYEPAERDGEPVAVRYTVSVRFVAG